MKTEKLLVLDFDGVVCDSIDECYVSSWLAVHGGVDSRSPFAAVPGRPDSVRLEDHRAFVRYRPFIRRGADYLLIQRCVSADVRLDSQADFDRLEAAAGAEMEEHHRRFYAVRTALLDRCREYWLGLNRLYPHVGPLLHGRETTAYILTTKEADFVREILAFHGLRWAPDLVICSGKLRKADIIADLLDRTGASSALFVDDQIDHLLGVADLRIDCRLASWGYVKREWVADARVRAVTPESFASLVGDW